MEERKGEEDGDSTTSMMCENREVRSTRRAIPL